MFLPTLLAARASLIPLKIPPLRPPTGASALLAAGGVWAEGLLTLSPCILSNSKIEGAAAS